jgi:hypothetical protein
MKAIFSIPQNDFLHAGLHEGGARPLKRDKLGVNEILNKKDSNIT